MILAGVHFTDNIHIYSESQFQENIHAEESYIVLDNKFDLRKEPRFIKLSIHTFSRS